MRSPASGRSCRRSRAPRRSACRSTRDTQFTWTGRRRASSTFKKDEAIAIPPTLDFAAISGLSNEIRQKLERHRPCDVGAGLAHRRHDARRADARPCACEEARQSGGLSFPADLWPSPAGLLRYVRNDFWGSSSRGATRRGDPGSRYLQHPQRWPIRISDSTTICRDLLGSPLTELRG